MHKHFIDKKKKKKKNPKIVISMRPGAIETAAAEWPYVDRTSLSAVLGNSSYYVKKHIQL